MIARLAKDARGATIVEFALIAPAFALMLMGAFDVGYDLYLRAAIQGIVQKTARDSGLEGALEAGATDVIDQKVRDQVRGLAANANISISRRFYRTFSQAAAARAETFTDTNNNGRCDAGEPYEDANGNQLWDADGGDQGQGGAKDKVVYTVTVTYVRLLPLWKMIGDTSSNTIRATTVLANQPYGDQSSYGATVVRNCP